MKICFINRSSIHYREEIYKLLDSELNVDFYFGDGRPGGIKPVNEALLKNRKDQLHNINLGKFYWQKGLLKFLGSDYDIVITPLDTYCINSWLFTMLAPLFGKKIFWWTHGAYGNEGKFKKLLLRWKIRHCYKVLLYGHYAEQILIKYGVDPNKLDVIYNSLSYDKQVELRSICQDDLYFNHFNNSNSNLVFTGRLTKVKKLNQILEAMNILKQNGLDCNLTLVGDGEERDYLEQIASSLNLSDNVWFYGACYDETQLSKLIFNADICVSPGNVGLTAMHAMAFGTPVISHDTYAEQMPEFEAIVPDKTGNFFEKDNVNSLANSIERWLKANYNREDIRKACFSVIDTKYNPYNQISIFKRLIGSI